MNSTTALTLFRVRSSQSAIRAGYRLYLGSFRKLLRRTWLFGVLYALAAGLVMKLSLDMLPRQMVLLTMYRQGSITPEALAQAWTWGGLLHGVASGLLCAVLILFTSSAFAALSEHRQTGSIAAPSRWYGLLHWPMALRVLRLTLWMLALSAVASLCCGLLMAVVLMAASPSFVLLAAMATVLAAIVTALALPLTHTAYVYLLEPDCRFLSILPQTYADGLRHWGSLFLVTLMVGLVTMLLSAVVMLPYYILAIALVTAQTGVLGGDPPGMPDYMGWMSTMVTMLSAFVMAYLYMSALFPFYYLYGSFTQEQTERTAIAHDRQ